MRGFRKYGILFASFMAIALLCGVASATGDGHEHTWVWKYDTTKHWQVCSICDRDNIESYADHTDGNGDGICDVCGYSSDLDDGTSMPPAIISTDTEIPPDVDIIPTDTDRNLFGCNIGFGEALLLFLLALPFSAKKKG